MSGSRAFWPPKRNAFRASYPRIDYRIASQDHDPVTAPQPNLFGPDASFLPEGMAYRPELVALDEEAALAELMARLPFAPFQFHGFEGNRRTLSYGWHYAF